MPRSTLIFQPYGKRIEISSEKSLLEAAKEIGVNINSICGGRGSCGKCKVIIRHGEEILSCPTEVEELLFSEEALKNGFRLACRSVVRSEGTIIIEVPPESQINRQRLLLKGLERPLNLAPAVKKVMVNVKKPSLVDVKADADRFVEAVESQIGFKPNVDYDALRKLPHIIREGNWTVTVIIWNGREIISIEPGTSKHIYGFAVDIGTTKLAAYLLDLKSGRIIATVSMMNPQIAYGEDVISRISYIMKNDQNLAKLHNIVVEGINHLINEACEEAKISPEEIYDMTVAGNTAMHHIFLGIPPNYVSLMPYPAVLQSPVDVKARELGVKINSGAYVHALPTIAGFVGGDAVADVLATGIWEMNDLAMLIDVGTNTEIVLGNKKKLTACSCASGPAFEGAHIKHGMRATTGAIEHVWIDPETLDVFYKTIGDDKPRGLCGSAIIDITAEMLKTGLIDQSGRFNIKLNTSRLRKNEDHAEFVIAWKHETAIENDIVVTQNDLREIQLAKAAIYTGASILMKRMGVKPDEIHKIFLAGAFGNYVDPDSARTIGMYPDVPLDRVQFVGNTAGSGARMTLLSVDVRKTAEMIAKHVEYLELGADSEFQDEFLKATYLPHREFERFPNVMELLEKTKRQSVL
ncbi:MAG: ASKHA domain-containing protein [Candidatus Bathyarchaeia archaeon]